MISQETHTSFLGKLFSEFDARSVEYCVVRNFESLPDRIDDDIDILIDKSDLSNVEAIIRELVSPDWHLLRIVRRNYHTQVFVTSRTAMEYAVSENRPVELIELDFVTDLQWRGIPYLDTASALQTRRRYRGFYILDADHHVSHLICHAILDKGRFSDKYWDTIADYGSEATRGSPIPPLPFLGLRASERIASAVRVGDRAIALSVRTGLIRRALTRPIHLVQYARYTLGKWVRILRAMLDPPGLLLTAVGPDGVGKTTLLLRVGRVLSSCFQPVEEVYMGWKDFILPTKRLLRWASRRGLRLPGRHPVERSASASADRSENDHRSWIHNFSVLHYFVDLYARYFVRIRPQLARGGLVLCDRYFYDTFYQRLYFTDSSFFRRILVRVSPLPTLTVVFAGDPRVIAERKREMTAEETAQQIAAYRTLLELNERTLELDAAGPLEGNVLSVVDRLVGFSSAGKSG